MLLILNRTIEKFFNFRVELGKPFLLLSVWEVD